jgi:hypothetical protein
LEQFCAGGSYHCPYRFVCQALPKLYTAFAQSLSVLDTASESEAMDQLYTNISTESFAERILSFTAYSARGGWIVRRAHRRRGSENGA